MQFKGGKCLRGDYGMFKIVRGDEVMRRCEIQFIVLGEFVVRLFSRNIEVVDAVERTFNSKGFKFLSGSF